MQRIPWIAAMAAFYNSPWVLSLAQPGRPAFLKDLVLGLPDDPGLGWLGDGVARRFEGHRSVFDRAAGLPKSANLAARLVAGGSRFSGTTPRVHAYRGQHFLPRPRRRSRLLLHLDSPVVTVGGHQEGAAVGYQARDRGKRGDDPGLGLEANASCRWDVDRRRSDAGTWAGSEELLAGGFLATPCAIGELGVRARAASATVRFGTCGRRVGPNTPWSRGGFPPLKRERSGWHDAPLNPRGEIAALEHRPQEGRPARRGMVARKRIEETDPEPTWFPLGTLRVSSLAHEPAVDTRRGMALLRWRGRKGATPPRASGGLGVEEDFHSRFCRQGPLSGSGSPRLQPGYRFAADLSPGGRAVPDAEQVTLPTLLAPG